MMKKMCSCGGKVKKNKKQKYYKFFLVFLRGMPFQVIFHCYILPDFRIKEKNINKKNQL
jgi:hypothetical protein